MVYFEQVLDVFRQGGWLLYILFFLMYCIWFLYFKNLLLVKRQLKGSKLNSSFTTENLSANSGLVGRFYRQIDQAVIKGVDCRDAFEEAKSHELTYWKSCFFTLTACVAAAPLCGLLGTVTGMVRTFSGLAQDCAISGELAAGIGQALITTQVGLLVALPGAFGIAHLKRRYQELRNAVDRLNGQFLLYYSEVCSEEIS